jgi:hypothetical protein
MTCGSSFPYSAVAKSYKSPAAHTVTENTYSACYWVYLNGVGYDPYGSYEYFLGGWVPYWPPGVLFSPTLSPIVEMKGTHNVCQTSAGTICNPTWVYTDAY